MTKPVITGVEDVNYILENIAPRHAKNLMRATVHDVAKEVRDDAREGMPEDEGTMKKETRHKRERGGPAYVESTVRVGGKAYYWRFLEYGDGPDGLAYDFFRNAVHGLRGELKPRFLDAFGRKFEAAVARARKK